MKRAFLAVCALVVSLSFGIENAEAARLGSGKSVGMQRQSVSPAPSAPVQQAVPTKAPAPAAAPAPAPKRNWLGPLAGLAAGLGIAALLSHFGLGEGFANFMMLALMAVLAVFVVRFLLARFGRGGAAPEPLQYAGAGQPLASQPVAPSPALAGSASAASSPAAVAELPRVPADFDVESFLRVAKLNFVRLQAANDAGDMNDLREFVSPELFAEIRLQLAERGEARQQTDVVTLNAGLLEVVTEAHQYIASVGFNGMIRERADAAAEPFSEVWNLVKPVDGRSGWVVAGIQQVQ